MQTLTATYSPEDNKLRLYSMHRLDSETYARIKAAGFGWAPKQDLFVAPMWTPEREDLLIELCGQIDDEDSTLEERAAQRADRFGGYSENRLRDAEAAHATANAISEHIPFGQPILVGHHSERRARKDAERINRSMHRAVEMCDRSRYWDRRAAGVIRNVAHKLESSVRHRRIKGLEADARKFARELEKAQDFQRGWSMPNITLRIAKAVANYTSISQCFPLADYPREAPASQYEGIMSLWAALDGDVITADQAKEIALAQLAKTVAWAERWKAHTDHRLAYERAQLGDDANPEQRAEKWQISVGGGVQVNGEWHTVRRVNRRGGLIASVTATAPASMHWRSSCIYSVEQITAYQAPTVEEAAAAKAPPIVNFAGEGFLHMTSAEYSKINRDYKAVRTEQADDEHGEYRYRVTMRESKLARVYLTDKKRVDRPVRMPARAQAIAA